MDQRSNGNHLLSATIPRKRGRPRQADAKSQAERAKAYRERLKANGLREVKCYLDAEHLAYLKGLCDIHGGTMAEAVALALSAVMRGDLPMLAQVAEPPRSPSVILLS